MRNYAPTYPALGRALAAWAVLLVAGGAATAPPSRTPPSDPVAVAPPPLSAPAEVTPAPAPPVPAIAPSRADVVIVVDTSAPSYAATAAAIGAELPPRRYRVTEIASDAVAELRAFGDRAATIVAVGAAAVTAARDELPGKDLVFCQVLAPETVRGDAARAWGVGALPPLTIQLRSWRAVDPSLRTVALIVADKEAALAREAAAAARDNGMDLVVENSSSDRETLYLFRRLAPNVDGLWLLPDSLALSPSALRELLSYATARGIGVLTFNDALLRRGALLSATSVTEDVAATVHRVIDRVVAGETADLPAVTPLSAAALEINSSVASGLGLTAPIATRWVVREPD